MHYCIALRIVCFCLIASAILIDLYYQMLVLLCLFHHLENNQYRSVYGHFGRPTGSDRGVRTSSASVPKCLWTLRHQCRSVSSHFGTASALVPKCLGPKCLGTEVSGNRRNTLVAANEQFFIVKRLCTSQC